MFILFFFLSVCSLHPSAIALYLYKKHSGFLQCFHNHFCSHATWFLPMHTNVCAQGVWQPPCFALSSTTMGWKPLWRQGTRNMMPEQCKLWTQSGLCSITLCTSAHRAYSYFRKARNKSAGQWHMQVIFLFISMNCAKKMSTAALWDVWIVLFQGVLKR